MIDYIHENEATIRLCIFVGGFVFLALWESLRPKRINTQPKGKRWLNNFGLVVCSTVILRFVVPMAAVSTAYSLHESTGLVNQFSLPFWAKVLVALILLDLSIYLQHILFHAIPTLWRIHRVHHSDLDCDVTTGLRFHPFEIVLSVFLKIAAIIMLGAPVLAVILFEILLNFMSMYTHANIRLNKSVDKVIRIFMVTPDMHELHHARAENETNSNFGFNISLWDRLFGTYMEKPKNNEELIVIGLDHFRELKWQALTGLAFMPFAREMSGYAINYRDSKNADEILLAKRIKQKNTENMKLLRDLNDLNNDLQVKVKTRTSELHSAKNETEKANKESHAKSAFLSHMSHELRTPLNAIIGFSEILLEEEETSSAIERRSDINNILGAGKHLLDLINDILDLARLESGKVSLELAPVDLDTIIVETLHLIAPLANKRDISIINDSNPGFSPIIQGNEKSVKEILINFLSNAVKYNNSGGKIILSTDQIADNRLKISVTDTGPGLTKEQQKLLFQSFNRLAENSTIEGTGIGLAITKNLVELMGGSIGVESDIDHGSTFWFSVPLLNDKNRNSDSQGNLHFLKTGR